MPVPKAVGQTESGIAFHPDKIQHYVHMVRTARAAPNNVYSTMSDAAPKSAYPTMWDKSLSPFLQMENNMDERPYALQALGKR